MLELWQSSVLLIAGEPMGGTTYVTHTEDQDPPTASV